MPLRAAAKMRSPRRHVDERGERSAGVRDVGGAGDVVVVDVAHAARAAGIAQLAAIAAGLTAERCQGVRPGAEIGRHHTEVKRQRRLARGERRLQRVLLAEADPGFHLRDLDSWNIELGEQLVDRVGDLRRGFHERAVEVENDEVKHRATSSS